MAGNVIQMRPLASAGVGAAGDGGNADPLVDTRSQPFQTLTSGSRGPIVMGLQQSLAVWGFSPGSADGIYGSNTAEAVRALQAKLGMNPDGIFGPGTAAAVRGALADPNSPLARNIVQNGATGPALPFQAPAYDAAQRPAVATSARPALPATTALAPRPGASQALPATVARTNGISPLVWVGLAAAAAGLFILLRRSTDRGAPALTDVDDEGEPAVDEIEEIPEIEEEEAVDVTPDAPPPPPETTADLAAPAPRKRAKRAKRKPMSDETKRMLAERKKQKRRAKRGAVDYLDTPDT
jgi:peptidoglycan hydrolase-like protein with peptidoglycan-binding domain